MVSAASFLSTAVVSVLYISSVIASPRPVPTTTATNPRDKCWQAGNNAVDGKFDIPNTHPCAKANDPTFPSYSYLSPPTNGRMLGYKSFVTVGAWNCCMACYEDNNCAAQYMDDNCTCHLWIDAECNSGAKLNEKVAGNQTHVYHPNINTAACQIPVNP